MAKIYGLNGIIRGRQGNNVFSVQNGTQVLKVYQPAVANPRTDAQQLQRAKFALAGKISAATPSAAIVGMRGGSVRERRGSYVSNLVRNASASLVGSSFEASVTFRNVLFSQGSVARYSTDVTMTASYAAGSWPVANASLGAMSLSTDAPAGYGELVVMGIFDSVGSPLDEIQVKVRSTTSTSTFTFHQNERSGFVAVCWVVPFIASSSEGALRAGNLGVTTNNDGVLLAADPLQFAASAEFGNSLYNNLVLVPAPAQAVSPAPDDRDLKKK